MHILNKLPIRQKIVAIILAITVISVISGLTIEVYSYILNSRQELIRDLSINAKLVSDYSSRALFLGDKNEAKNILLKLNDLPSVLHCALYDKSGEGFVGFNKPGLTDTAYFYLPGAGKTKNNKLIYITEDVTHEGVKVGEVFLVGSTEQFRDHIVYHIRTILLIFLLIVIITIFLSIILERIISHPILNLMNFTKKILTSGDFSTRIKKKTLDETGMLYDSFNELIIKLEALKQEKNTAEKELLEERKNFEKRVLERTRELNEAKLKAEESDMLKSSFLANMSHEIRTPLNAILGFANFISNSSLTEAERLEYSTMMDVSARDLINLIDDILDVSRIEANQVKITLEDCQVNVLIKEVYETFKQTMGVDKPDSKVKPVLNIPDENKDYILNTDRLRLRQILLNILNNAKKFTQQGFIEIGYFDEENNKNLIFYVKDTGIGIDFINREKIFERFTKVSDMKTKHYRGTGLGLSIALKLAKMLNGDIRVESEVNKGSIFYVSIPYKDSFQASVVSSVPGAVDYAVSLQGKTLLIVEDIEWNYKFLEVILSKFGKADILWAKDGAKAVNLCKKHSEIDLVLMDIEMPVMDGYEATRHIKKIRPELPIIAQSAYVMINDKEKCFDAGCQGFLPKPIRKEELFKVINELLF